MYQFNRLGKGCLSYMVISNGEAAVIDAVEQPRHMKNLRKEHAVTITNVMDTHLHRPYFRRT